NRHHESTIAALAERYLVALRELIAHCREPEAGGYTPSDFPLARLSQPELDRLVEESEALASVYPLSPLQQGLLFHSLYAPGGGDYVIQVGLRLEGDMQPELLVSAFERVLERHPILRTSFVWEGLSEPHQVVHGEVRLPHQEEDWRELSAEEQEERLTRYLSEDRAAGFELSRAPLMRLGLFHCGEDSYEVVWSFHHLLLDGWSLPVVAREVLSSYRELAGGPVAELGAAHPYEDYIGWQEGQDRTEAEAFWRQALAGFEAPTQLDLAR